MGRHNRQLYAQVSRERAQELMSNHVTHSSPSKQRFDACCCTSRREPTHLDLQDDSGREDLTGHSRRQPSLNPQLIRKRYIVLIFSLVLSSALKTWLIKLALSIARVRYALAFSAKCEFGHFFIFMRSPVSSQHTFTICPTFRTKTSRGSRSTITR
jgi:hypothetical protein